MSAKRSNYGPVRIYLWPLLVVLGGGGLAYGVAILQYRTDDEQRRDAVRAELESIHGALSRELFGAIYLTEGIAALIAIEGGINDERFSTIAAELIQRSAVIRNVAVAPENVVRYVFPLEGNEQAIGLEYASTPDQWESVERMMAERRMIVAGPVQLVQGGVGVIGRTPIYVPDPPRERRYWGLTSTVVDFDQLLARTPLATLGHRTRIAMRGRDGTGENGEVFWGDADVFETSPVVLDVVLPSGSWQLAATPSGGWPPFHPLGSAIFLVGGLLSCVFSGLLLGILHQRITRQLDQKALREREQRLSSIYDTVGDILFHLAVEPDERYRFLSVNPAFSRVTGVPAAAVVGHTVDEVIPAPSLGLALSRYRQAIADKAVVRWEETTDYPTGRLTGEVTIAPVFDATDQCTHLVGSVHDISERKRAEEALRESEQRYRATLDNTLEGCQLIGFDWRYLYLNDAASAHNRRPNAELLGHTMQEMWPGIEQALVYGLIEGCLQGRSGGQKVVEFGFPDGTTGWFDVRVQPVSQGALVLSIELTQRIEAELALRALNQRLESEVAARTSELVVAKDRAESADRLKSAFLATMSHELRTPLNSIIGFTGIILQGLAGPLNAEQTKQLGMVRSSARHLLELINDVLDISKIEAGEMKVVLASFDLRATIERCVAAVRPSAEAKHLALKVEIGRGIRELVSDARRVSQILLNLLNNAVKFTDRGEVVLAADVVEAAVCLRITDTGIGMKAEDLATLFRPFRQVDTGLARTHEGTGLGLVICRRLADLLGGEIRVESTPNQGSTFTFVLPLTHPTQPTQHI